MSVLFLITRYQFLQLMFQVVQNRYTILLLRDYLSQRKSSYKVRLVWSMNNKEVKAWM